MRLRFSRSRVSHSQIVITRQPALRRELSFRRSRATFCENFVDQKSTRDLGMEAFEQPSCRCQKQPCTNITVRNFGKTISGDPGRSLRCSRNLSPSACSERLTIISGLVLVRPTDLIIRLRTGSTSVLTITVESEARNRQSLRTRPKACRPSRVPPSSPRTLSGHSSKAGRRRRCGHLRLSERP